MSDQWYADDVLANGIKLHYYRSGGEKPPVVLSHGITDNGLCWTPLARVLAKDYDVIMYDARGHGLSEAPEAGYSYNDLSADLAGLIQELHLNEPRLIGHSLGAATVAMTAANYPDLMRCAILEDPPWRPEIPNMTREDGAAMADEWRSNVVELKSRSRAKIVAICRAENPKWSDDECGPWADSKLQLDLKIFRFFAAAPSPWQDVVQRISCSVLLVTGDPELGAIVTPEIAEEAAGLWRNGKVAHIDGSGHSIRREQFAKYVDAVTRFLAEA